MPHALVSASGGLHAYNTRQDSSNDYTRNRQYEAAIGGYATVKHTWLSAAVGAGQGRSYRYGRFGSSDFLNFGVVPITGGGKGGRIPVPELLGYYNTRFAQVTAWWTDAQRPAKTWSTSLRLTQVRFTDLTLNGVAQPTPSQYYLQTSVLLQQPLGRQLKWYAAASFDLAPEGVMNEQALPVTELCLRVGLAFCPAKPTSAAVPAP